MFRVLLLGLFISPTFSLDISKVITKAPKNYIEVRTTCYLTNDEKIRRPRPVICPTLAHLVKKYKNTKTLDRYVLCHNIKADYLLLVPEDCTVTYCTPCTYKLV